MSEKHPDRTGHRGPTVTRRAAIGAIAAAAVAGAGAITAALASKRQAQPEDKGTVAVTEQPAASAPSKDAATEPSSAETVAASSDELFACLDIAQIMHREFGHGPKGVEYQKYIVLHDTEGDGEPENIVSYWAENGNLVAAQFVVGRDGHIAQCVPMDEIAHHAGYGDAGHNELYGVTDESRDDKLGTKPVGSSCPDYGMNSYSIGIETVHVGGEGDYPQAQLDALDALIAYIDAYYAGAGRAQRHHRPQGMAHGKLRHLSRIRRLSLKLPGPSHASRRVEGAHRSSFRTHPSFWRASFIVPNAAYVRRLMPR